MIRFEDFRDKRSAAASVLSTSDNPDDQDKARKLRVQADYDDLLKQKSKKKVKEEVGISSSVAIKKAQAEAKKKAIEDRAVAKQKAVLGKDVKEAKVDTGSAAEKATARNKRNTPAGKDYDFDNKVFITRKPGESLDSARTRTRQKAHAAKRGVKEEVELSEQWVDSAIELSTDYFFHEGLNEEGVELVIEEVGLDDFVEFVLDPIEELNEERSAKKAAASAPSYEKVKKKVDAADAARKKAGKGEYAKTAAAKRNYGDEEAPEGKPVAKKAPAKKVTVKKVTPPKKAATKKKVVASVAKAKKKQPLKPTSKKGIRGAIERGVARHQKAVGKAKKEVGKVVKTAKATAKQHSQHRKDFVKGISPTAKEKKIAKGVGKAVKKSLTREELELLESRDKAFDNVVAKIRAKHGYDSVITKDNPPKPPTEAQKKAYAAHKAKIAKQDTRDDLEKSSSGRYSRKYSNRGSD